MERNATQSGYELVLDARRLIVGFALLIFVCGAFFILGFVEGKRQAVQASLAQPGAPTPTVLPEPPKTDRGPASVAGVPGKAADRTSPDQLDWYDRVSEKRADQTALQQPPAAAAARPPGTVEPKTKVTVAAPKAVPKALYSCQVGAFRLRKEAEAKAAALKSRGYDSFIEPPQTAGSYFLLKVGQFETHTEAAAMQLRLRKDGIATFIKTNR